MGLKHILFSLECQCSIHNTIQSIINNTQQHGVVCFSLMVINVSLKYSRLRETTMDFYGLRRIA
jgi:hypothetical protein